MDTRIGYPNEHLAGNSSEEISSPLFATAVGLVMNSIENSTQSAVRMEIVNEQPKVVYRNVPPQTQQPVQQRYEVEENYVERVETIEETREVVRNNVSKEESTETKIRRSFYSALSKKSLILSTYLSKNDLLILVSVDSSLDAFVLTSLDSSIASTLST